MKKMFAIEFFPLDCAVILSYTNQDFWSKSSYSKNYIDEICNQLSRKDTTLWDYNIEPSFEENIEVVEEDQVFQQIDEFKLEDDVFQEIDEEVKEKNIELIEKNGEYHENTVQELCVEDKIFFIDSIEAKDEKMEISEEINKDPIIEKDLEIEIVKAIKEDQLKINSKGKSMTHKSNNPIVFTINKVLQYVDFIGVERFDWVIDSYWLILSMV
jgi:hypothetical protein